MIEFDNVIILKKTKKWNCQYLGNEMKYEAEICYVEVFYYADFDYGMEIRNSNQQSKSIKFDDVIILKTRKTWNCQYLGSEIKYEAEIW